MMRWHHKSDKRCFLVIASVILMQQSCSGRFGARQRRYAGVMSTLLRAPSTMSLLCLEASARLRSFTAAASELHLTQGAVSRQIIALESRLGTTLFVRRRQALALTEAGATTWLKLRRCCSGLSALPPT